MNIVIPAVLSDFCPAPGPSRWRAGTDCRRDRPAV